MRSNSPFTKLGALMLAVAMVLSVATPAAIGVASAGNEPVSAGNAGLSVGVQQGAGTVTVAVTDNGSAVDNATVNITSDGAYSKNGITDGSGTVSFDEPNETVNATVKATTTDGRMAETNVTLRGNEGLGAPFVPFGQRVAAFVHGLQQSGGVIAIGPFVADYVYALAPMDGPASTAAPPWAADGQGPPDHANSPGASISDNGENDGPPEHAGNETGPPDEPGPPDGDDEGNGGSSQASGNGNGAGPPDDNPGNGNG